MDNCFKRRENKMKRVWQGREYSRATALYSFRARWYDPAAGRWLSKDPIGLEGGLNLYEAFGNNPVCFADFLGLDIYVHCENGHAELYIDNPQSSKKQTLFGFYPKTGGYRKVTLDVIYGNAAIEFRDYGVPESEDCICIKTTLEQDKRALSMVNVIQSSAIPYSFAFNNCAHMARLVLTAAGLPLGNKVFDTPDILKKDVQEYLETFTK